MSTPESLLKFEEYNPTIRLNDDSFTKFFNELCRISEIKGFSNIHYDIEFDIRPELVFKLEISDDVLFSTWFNEYDYIIKHMKVFSQKNNCFEIFDKSYIVVV